MKSYTLNRDIYFSRVDGGNIFLDARNDRYFCVIGDQAKWLSELQNANETDILSPRAEAFAQHLLQKKILSPYHDEGKAIEACEAPPPHSSTFDEMTISRRKPRLTDFPLFAYAFLSSRRVWHSRHDKINRILAAIKQWKRRAAPAGFVPIERLVERTELFHAITPYFFTTHNECFFRSVCLIRYLNLFCMDCDLVFGVQSSPFAAHCWVERDGVVLNDYFENARNYIKILVV